MPVPALANSNRSLLVASPLSTNATFVSVKFLFVSVSLELRLTRVSAPVGNVNVPPLLIDAMVGVVSVLFVSVSVVVRATSVSDASGNVIDRLFVCDNVNVVVVDVVAPPSWTISRLVASPSSTNAQEASTSDLFVSDCVAAIVANVPAPDGIVTVPPFVMDAIVGVVRVLFVNVSVLVRDTSVSVKSGKVKERFAVCDDTSVVVVDVVAPPNSIASRLVASPLSTNKHDASTRDLFVKVSVLEAVMPPLNVCHVAVVEDVAVNTWPFVGAVAPETDTSVVALFKSDAVKVFVAPVIVLFVSVSVVLRATSVSVLVGSVKVPVFTIDEITGDVRVLFVSVSVVVRATSVSVASGSVTIRFAVCDDVNIVVVPVVAPPNSISNLLVASPLSTNAHEESTNVLFVNACAPAIVAKVPAPDGIVIVPPLLIDAMVGKVKVLFVSVSVDVLETSTSVKSGNVKERFAVCEDTRVVVVLVVAPANSTPNRLVASPLSTNKHEASTSDLFVSESVVARPTSVSVLVGRVRVPVFTIVAITGAVRVLFVNVSVVARPTSVSVLVGRVNVPVFTIEAITGVVSVLFVKVSVDVRETSVSVTLGNVNTRFAVCDRVNVVVVAVVAPPSSKFRRLVASASSTTKVDASTSDLFVNDCVAAMVANVPAPEGIVIVPPFVMDAMVGVVRVLFVKVSVDVLETRTSVKSGNVKERLFV